MALVAEGRAGPAAGGGAAPAGAQDQQRLHLPAPLAGGTAGGRGRVVLAVQGVLRFLGRGGGQVFPARLTVQTQRWMSGPSATPAFRCRSRFRAGSGAGAVRCRAEPPAARLVLIWSSTSLGPLPCPSWRWGCALFPAPPWPGTVSCRPSRPACAAPALPPGKAWPSTSMPPSPTSPRRLMGGKCWWGWKRGK